LCLGKGKCSRGLGCRLFLASVASSSCGCSNVEFDHEGNPTLFFLAELVVATASMSGRKESTGVSVLWKSLRNRYSCDELNPYILLTKPTCTTTHVGADTI
jgi:hypothetical protein